MTLVQGLLRALASGLALAAPQVVAELIAYFQGVPPTDVNSTAWGVISLVAIFLLNILVSKLPTRSA